jgi:hypothetical protein
MMIGGCQCGAIRYEVSGRPMKLYVCHCRECRKQTASAFGISAIVRREDFRLTQGTPKSWVRVADSGSRLRLMFCRDCGTRVWHDRESIEGGSLDTPLDLRTAVHVWISRKLPGVIIPESTTQFPEEPDPPKPAA